MTTFISLLRGINVSGQKKIRMQDLRDLYASINLGNASTYLQSGNVVFETNLSGSAKIETKITAAIEKQSGYSVSVLLRTGADFKRIIRDNPILKAANVDPSKLHVTFLQRTPSESRVAGLQPPENISDEFVILGQEVFVHCPGGYGRTKLTNNFFEKKLNVPATTRNWKTVNALDGLAMGRS